MAGMWGIPADFLARITISRSIGWHLCRLAPKFIILKD